MARRLFRWTWVLGWDFFLSYRRDEASEYAKTLATHLESAGFEVYLDREETPGGEVLGSEIERSLRRSRALVVILTPNVHHSTWVRREVDIAQGRRGKVVPISVGGYLEPSTSGLAYPTEFENLRQLAWINESRSNVESGTPARDVIDALVRGHDKLRVRKLGRAVAILLLLVLFGVSLVAGFQGLKAVRESRNARARQLALQAQQALDSAGDVLGAGLLAAESLTLSNSFEAEQTLRTVLRRLPARIAEYSKVPATDLAFDPRSGAVSVLLGDGTARQSVAEGLAGAGLRCHGETKCLLTEGGLVLVSEEPDQGEYELALEHLVLGSRVRLPLKAVPVTTVGSANGNVIATVDRSGLVCVIDVTTGRARPCFEAKPRGTIALNANGSILQAVVERGGDEYDTLAAWDTSNGKLLIRVKASSLTPGPLGLHLAVAHLKSLRIYSVKKRVYLDPIPHPYEVADVLFDPTESLVVTKDEVDVGRVWAVESGEQAASAPLPSLRLERFTFDGRTLVTSDRGRGRLELWWIGENARGNPELRPGMTIATDGPIERVAVSASAPRIATLARGDDGTNNLERTIELWDLSDGNALAEQWRTGSSASAATLAGGTWWSEASREGVTLVRGPELAETRQIAANPGSRYLTVNVSPDGSLAAIGGADQPSRRLFAMEDLGKELLATGGRQIAFGPGSLALFHGASSMEAWDLGSRRKLTDIRLENVELQTVTWGADGRYLFLTDRQSDMFVVDPRGQRLVRAIDVDTKDLVEGPVVSGVGVAVALYAEGKVVVWDLLSARAPFRFDAQPARVLTVSPDGRFLALWPTLLNVKAADESVFRVSLWSAAKGAPAGSIAHDSAISSAQFSANGAAIASHDGRTVKVLHPGTGRPISQLVFEAPITNLMLTADAQYLTVSGAYNHSTFGRAYAVLKTLRLRPEELVIELCRRAAPFRDVLAALRNDENLIGCTPPSGRSR